MKIKYMNLNDLKEQYAILKTQLSEVNAQISNILKTKNKRYTYSNIESTHSAELQSITDLRLIKKQILEDITSIENQIKGPFVQIKRC